MKKQEKEDRNINKENLKVILNGIKEVYIDTESKNNTRHIRVFIVECGRIKDITGIVAKAFGYRYNPEKSYKTFTVSGLGFSAANDVFTNIKTLIQSEMHYTNL